MSYNFINEAASIGVSALCKYDTIAGYASDFTENGDVSGWDYYDGIHTYGSWSGFLFGTLYGGYALIGRYGVFKPVPAETHYTVRLVMKLNTVERTGARVDPTVGRLMWATLANSVWGSDKSMDFTIYPDNKWHEYIINAGGEQWWQGDVNNLRIYPILSDGVEGDEFFIKTIEIVSVKTYDCKNIGCDYYSKYSHPCGGIGTRGYCKSSPVADTHTIVEGVNDELILNINGYGSEIITLDAVSAGTGPEVSKLITIAASKLAVGGYAEIEVYYTENNEFIIYSGTYATDSTVVVEYNNTAVDLGFFNEAGSDISSKENGSMPASLFSPASSFKIKSFQLLSLFDGDEGSSFLFEPSTYSIEGGRADWLEAGLGRNQITFGDSYASTTALVTRDYDIIDNIDKTIIDYTHPFNASGRIRKMTAAVTLDRGYLESDQHPTPYPKEYFAGRLEGTGCKILVLRPKHNGNLEVVESVDIPDRDYSEGRLYSQQQEYTEIDCDIWVNKGDYLGIYNADVYGGKSTTGNAFDAMYYQIDGEATGEITPGRLLGNGVGGLLIYARSLEIQEKLTIDIDLGNRVNIEEINIIGSTDSTHLEFNVARCLDINWNVDFFGLEHITGAIYVRDPWHPEHTWRHNNVGYGVDLGGGSIIKTKNGVAGESFVISPAGTGNSQSGSDQVTPGIIVNDPAYFMSNGDGEWIGVYQHTTLWVPPPIGATWASAYIDDFIEDPIAFTLLFPHNTTKTVYKVAIYFKEKFNFRDLALSTTSSLNDMYGDADDPRFNLIPEYSAITIDGRRIVKDGPGYNDVNLYLFANPSVSRPVVELTGELIPMGWGMPPGRPGYIQNNDQSLQADNTDWTVITHEFEPIDCKGFRYYTDYHESTKVCEMEVYCYVEDVGTSMVGSIYVSTSHYGDLWWVTSLAENEDTSVTAFVGDTPRYISIEITPITNMRLNEIRFDIKKDDIYMGEKGCQYELLPIHSKRDSTNDGTSIDVKNVYGGKYDLYVNIAEDAELDSGLAFFSTLNSLSSITKPEVGPNARYYKEDDYLIRNDYGNCAINNECYGLRNLIDGKSAYYSYLGAEQGWQEFGTLETGVSIDFSNIEGSRITTIHLPVFSKNRYWKFGWFCGGHPTTNVREIKIFYENEELEAIFYHDKNLEFESGPISDTAPHLNNNSATGSYYQLKDNHYIGFDLGSQKIMDKIILYHDSFADYDETYCGIDKYTELCMTVKDGDIVDYSYNERSFTIVGTGIDPAIGYWGSNTAIGFSGGVDSYISVPASSDWAFPGAIAYEGPPWNEAFTVDFFVKFDSLPTTGEYCTLIRNWSDVVDTGRYGDIPYPPPNYYSGFTMSSLGQGQPNANWAIFVRHIDNVAAAERLGLGGSHDNSSLQGGDHLGFRFYDGELNTNVSFKNSAPTMYTQINLPSPKTVNRYGVYSYTPTTSRVLRDFKFQAYVTASGTWLDLHSVTGFTASSWTQVSYYDFTNPYPACTSYRLLITANNGDGAYTVLNELELYAVEGGYDLCQLEFWAQTYNPPGWYDGGHKWYRNIWPEAIEVGVSYNISMYRQAYGSGAPYYTQLMCFVNGNYCAAAGITQQREGLSSYAGQLKIGDGLDGVLTDVRITKDLKRNDYTPSLWHQKERYYVMSLYVSDDNHTYGKYLDVDLVYDGSYHYYDSNSTFSLIYDSYFAIDLGNRYDLDLIRSYGNSDRHELSFYGENSELIDYSNDETDDVELVTWTGRDSWANDVTLWAGELSAWGVWDVWDGVHGNKCTVSKVFTPVNCTGLTKENGMLVIDMKCGANFQYFDYTRGSQIQITSSATANVQEWGHELTGVELEFLADMEYHTYYIPLKHFHTTGGELDVSQIDYIEFYAYGTSSTKGLQLFWKNAKIIWSVPDALEVINDVRWLRIELPNDGVSKTLRKIGIYPDISTRIGPGGGVYNHEWDSLGTSVTDYASPNNLALGAAVSGSSYFGFMTYDKITDGVIDEVVETDYVYIPALFDNSWGSSNEANPYIIIDLGTVYNIYKIVLFHGYDGRDSNYMVRNYTVQTSVDGQSYSTQVTVTNNSSFERTHDFPSMSARYVKVAISSYYNESIMLRTDLGGTVEMFEGAVLREIRIYETYNITSISSEEYPIICLNLRDVFYINSHSIIGLDSQDTSDDWSNNDFNFCYSFAVHSEPQKIDFREWGDDPYYDQWVAVKMNTATNYNKGPHYLKHVRVKATYPQNPCDYPWWWQSDVSTLSRSYSHEITNCISSLQIDYPASSTVDNVSFLEGDHFGIDNFASWRDGFNMNLRIDDIDNLDTSYGYLYFGGYDNTTAANPITYKWYFSTLSGILASGQTNLYLRFKSADVVEYTELVDIYAGDPDPRIISNVTLGSMGMMFKGVGNPITLNLDGFRIMRNHFQDYSSYVNGLYLTGSEYFTCPIGEFEMTRGAIEFWLRPDYNQVGYDFYNTLKNRAIFHFGNNANDVLGMMFTYNGMEFYCGNLSDEEGINTFVLDFDWSDSFLDTTFHIGVVFSNDGTQISNDGSTLRVYINNDLVITVKDTWAVNDNKHFNFVFGGKGPLGLKVAQTQRTGSVDGVISNFKIYNYCKTDFYNSMAGNPDVLDNLAKPSSLIEISRDNLTYYKVRDGALPFKFEAVPDGVSTPIYVRTILPDNLSGEEKRTAGLLVYWDLGV